ncbi:DNA-methyltransferase [Amycolatopsis sp. cmx-4-68]|uniref:DNA-methyltransferase n=1 Tax=Amycolatopsis sp. cmx-4-68 TaxID=2790938 RepID=UPI00397DACEA
MNASEAPPDRQPDVTLITADAQAGIARLPDDSVDCLVTSPPYWRLRDCARDTWTGGRPDRRHRPAGIGTGDDRSHRCQCRDCGARREHPQIGPEPTADDYIDTLRTVFSSACRVLTPHATVWINLGDSYSTNSDGYWCAAPGQAGQPHYRPVADVPHKNLLGMPWRLALALQGDGWILRSAIVWHKPHATPTPIRDRLATRHEMISLFVTQTEYYFSPDRSRGDIPHPLRWKSRAAASLPGCPPGGHVLDPFSGGGTTGVAARALGRRFTGIDTHPDYHRITRRRLDRDHNSGQWGTR